MGYRWWLAHSLTLWMPRGYYAYGIVLFLVINSKFCAQHSSCHRLELEYRTLDIITECFASVVLHHLCNRNFKYTKPRVSFRCDGESEYSFQTHSR